MRAKSYIAENLRFLARQHGTISEACRVLGINRQQFNKYLADSTAPSMATLTKICDHFVIEEDEISLPPHTFKALFRPNRPRDGEGAGLAKTFWDINQINQHSDPRLSEYVGTYARYFLSFSRPEMIMKSLMRIDISGGIGVFRTIERIRSKGRRRRATLFKYRGLAFFLRERIFLIGHEALGNNELTQTVLVPTYANGVSNLYGIIAGCSAAALREPMASRIVLERLDEPVSMRRMVRQLDAYPHDSPEIPADIERFLRTGTDFNGLMRATPK